MADATPDTAVRDRLLAAPAVAGLTTENTWAGPVRPSPALAVSCEDQSETHEGAPLGVAVEDRSALVLVTVRDLEGRFAEGQALARAVRTKLHLATLTGYWCCFVQAGPIYRGQDGSRRHRWELHVLLRWRQT